MRLALCAVAAVFVLSDTTASGQDRFAERTPLPRVPPEHTMARAGNPNTIAPWAIPGVRRSEAGGYVGGGSLRGNNVFSKSAVATGPITTGTFGWDYAGHGGRTGRVFLAPSADPSAGPATARNYRTDGPRLPDPIALRPFRRAILAKKEAEDEHKKEAEGEHKSGEH